MGIRQKVCDLLEFLSSMMEDEKNGRKTEVVTEVTFNECAPSGSCGCESLTSSTESAIHEKEEKDRVNEKVENVKKKAQQMVDEDKQNLIEELVKLILEFESYRKRVNDDNSKQILDMINGRLIETMKDFQLTAEATSFDSRYHTVSPFEPVKNGTPIVRVIRPGIEYRGVVLLKAVVEVKK